MFFFGFGVDLCMCQPTWLWIKKKPKRGPHVQWPIFPFNRVFWVQIFDPKTYRIFGGFGLLGFGFLGFFRFGVDECMCFLFPRRLLD